MGVMMCVQRINLYSYTYLCRFSSEGSMSSTKNQLYMGTQHAHRIVVKKNTTTEDICNNTEEKHREYRKLGKSNQWPPAQTCTSS